MAATAIPVTATAIPVTATAIPVTAATPVATTDVTRTYVTAAKAATMAPTTERQGVACSDTPERQSESRHYC
jgi:hypothetical protein